MQAYKPPTYVPASHLHLLCPVDVRQQAQAEPLRVAGVGEAVHRQRRLGGMEGFSYPHVQLVVSDGTPVFWLLVRDWLQLSTVVYV